MADGDESGTQNIVINEAPAPAAPAAPAQPPVKAASRELVNSFLSHATPNTIAGASPGEQPGSAFTGYAKGFGRQVLGLAELLPAIGHYFDRHSYLGEKAYAPVHGAAETAGYLAGSATPWLLAGEVIAPLRGAALGINAIRGAEALSPRLGTLARGIYKDLPGRAAAGTTANIGGRTVNIGGRMTPARPTIGQLAARGAVAGGIGGAAEQPPDTSISGEVTGRIGGAIMGAAAGATTAGLGGVPASTLGKAALAVGSMIGAYELGPQGTAGVIISALALHHFGVGVEAARAWAPYVASHAAQLAGRFGPRLSSTAGALAAQAGEQEGTRQ